jgi:hypothetical protein
MRSSELKPIEEAREKERAERDGSPSARARRERVERRRRRWDPNALRQEIEGTFRAYGAVYREEGRKP